MLRAYLDCFDLQFQRGVFVDDDHGVRVQLETRKGPHVIEPVLDAFLQGDGFVGACDDDDDFAGLVRMVGVVSLDSYICRWL